MNLKHPASEEFAGILDKACGRMTGLGLEGEAMFWLADELACMLSNDSFKARPLIPHAKELYRIVVGITLHLKGERPVEDPRTESLQGDQVTPQRTLLEPS